MDKLEIAPCPYCGDGGHPFVVDAPNFKRYVACGVCGCAGPVVENENNKEAIEKWNSIGVRNNWAPISTIPKNPEIPFIVKSNKSLDKYAFVINISVDGKWVYVKSEHDSGWTLLSEFDYWKRG